MNGMVAKAMRKKFPAASFARYFEFLESCKEPKVGIHRHHIAPRKKDVWLDEGYRKRHAVAMQPVYEMMRRKPACGRKRCRLKRCTLCLVARQAARRKNCTRLI
jgi:hypothetical protein